MVKRRKKILIVVFAFIMIFVVGIVVVINFGPMLLMDPAESGNFSNSSISIIENDMNNVFLINSNGWIYNKIVVLILKHYKKN